MDEPQFLSVEEEELDLASRGKIDVRIQRVELSRRRKPAAENVITPDRQPLLMQAESNKKVIMDNGRSHFTRSETNGKTEVACRKTNADVFTVL